ncbi:MAG TPA: branched-chain amino acid aminotransferase [Candidatus Ruania gallistercoris]|uniref:Branched-chain amino acid aminotransferase n=1 Tax=Candidatus Ruania gallistercoris TaxID=2838746 RepID=A0A9D2J5F3_9MICO|nr:branched-chain amino acid aminotransferase [Candidatus Ruania gallistercoris]
MTTPALSNSHPAVDGAPHYRLHRHPAPCSPAERDRALTAPGFGKAFTDHMARARWATEGWGERRVEPYAPLSLDPAAAVLHYGQEIFEGLKAYRHADGSVWTFRPELNAARFAASARRLALPELPEADFLASITALVRADVDWVPRAPGSSLYLRPFMFAAEAFLGVRSAQVVDYLVIASPSGPYFSNGFAPVDIWVADRQHRAGPGGTGAAKTGGNYAASLQPQQQAAARACDQVCFLDAATNSLLEEIGSMNVLLVTRDGAVHTPELTGTILAGVTRASVLDLCRAQGRPVHERAIPLAEVLAGLRSGEVTEVFACGTAAVITPIGRLAGAGFDLTVGDGAPGPVTTALYEELTGIQRGTAVDDRGWMFRLA